MGRRVLRKSDLPYKSLLIALAEGLDGSNLSAKESQKISHILRGLAVGQTLDEALGIRPALGRPETIDVFQRVWDVAVLSNPKKHWGGGHSIEEAIQQTADAHCVSPHTIEENWKSWEGRMIRDFVRRVLVNPLEVPLTD